MTEWYQPKWFYWLGSKCTKGVLLLFWKQLCTLFGVLVISLLLSQDQIMLSINNVLKNNSWLKKMCIVIGFQYYGYAYIFFLTTDMSLNLDIQKRFTFTWSCTSFWYCFPIPVIFKNCMKIVFAVHLKLVQTGSQGKLLLYCHNEVLVTITLSLGMKWSWAVLGIVSYMQ